MYLSILPTHVCVPCMSLVPGSQKSVMDFLELTLQTIVSDQVGAGNQTDTLEEQYMLLTSSPAMKCLPPNPLGSYL